MTIDTEFLAMMPTNVDCYKWLGKDAVGNNIYDTAVRHKARVENLTRTMSVTTSSGETVIADIGDSVQLIIDYREPIINERDKVVVITPTSSRELRVITQTTEYDEDGPYYQALVCQNNQEQ